PSPPGGPKRICEGSFRMRGQGEMPLQSGSAQSTFPSQSLSCMSLHAVSGGSVHGKVVEVVDEPVVEVVVVVGRTAHIVPVHVPLPDPGAGPAAMSHEMKSTLSLGSRTSSPGPVALCWML